MELSEEQISAQRYVGLEKGKMLEESNKIFKGILQYVEEVSGLIFISSYRKPTGKTIAIIFSYISQ